MAAKGTFARKGETTNVDLENLQLQALEDKLAGQVKVALDGRTPR